MVKRKGNFLISERKMKSIIVGALASATLKITDGQWTLTLQDKLQQKRGTNNTLFIKTMTELHALNAYINQTYHSIKNVRH